jgi:hypothetical protein
VQGTPRVPGPCNLASSSRAKAQIRDFNHAVSDHCAVVFEIR